MQATRTYARVSISKHLWVLIAALLTGLLMVSLYVVIRMNDPATSTSVHVVSGPPDASVAGSAWNFNSRHHGTQSVEGPAPGAPSVGSAREPSSGRSGPQLVP
jgi:hypothetical protein